MPPPMPMHKAVGPGALLLPFAGGDTAARVKSENPRKAAPATQRQCRRNAAVAFDEIGSGEPQLGIIVRRLVRVGASNKSLLASAGIPS